MPLTGRPNLGSAVGFRWGIPDVARTRVAEDYRFVADTGAVVAFTV
jgi:hypothetical protein